MNRQPAGSPVGGQFAPDSHAKKPVVIEPISLTEEEYEAEWQQFGTHFANEFHKWRDAGIMPDEAIRWRLQMFSAQEAVEWKNAGFPFEEASKWIKVNFLDEEKHALRTPDNAQQWRNLGFTYLEANDWYTNFSATADDAAKWRDAGFGTPYDADEWRRVGFTTAEADDAAKWSKTSVYPITAYHLHKSGCVPGEEWKVAGIPPDEAERWQKSRFSYALAVEWHNAGFSPEEASKWDAVGFCPYDTEYFLSYAGRDTPSDAKQWYGAGFTPEEAREWRENGHDFNSALWLRSEGKTP